MTSTVGILGCSISIVGNVEHSQLACLLYLRQITESSMHTYTADIFLDSVKGVRSNQLRESGTNLTDEN